MEKVELKLKTMKAILTLLLLFTTLFTQAWEQDKTKHLLAGAVINVGTQVVVYQITKDRNKAMISGILSGVLISAGKELIYDKMMKKGNPEWADFGAGCIGVTITVPIKFILK
jgi:competence protein ComGC